MNELLAQLLRAPQWRFIGRLGGDPDTKYFQSGSSVTTVRIAINQPGAKKDDGKQPDWFKVEIWGEQGVALADTAHKGDQIDVSGRVRTETWTDRTTGEERRALTVTADSWSLVGQPTPAAKPAAKPAAPTPPPVWNGDPLSGPIDDSDIPF